MTADSLCTYIASGQRSHKGMCPGLAWQYFFMPDTETFIECPCTTLLPVPLFIFYQSMVLSPFKMLSESIKKMKWGELAFSDNP